MGSINYGNQIISLPFETQGTSFNINQMMFDIMPTGILSGGVIAKSGINSVTVAPLICWISDPVNQIAVKVQTTNLITLDVSDVNIYVVLRFVWVGSPTNYMDIYALPYGSIEPTDLIIGKCVYEGGVLQSTFDYTEASTFTLAALQNKAEEFLVEVYRALFKSSECFIRTFCYCQSICNIFWTFFITGSGQYNSWKNRFDLCR